MRKNNVPEFSWNIDRFNQTLSFHEQTREFSDQSHVRATFRFASCAQFGCGRFKDLADLSERCDLMRIHRSSVVDQGIDNHVEATSLKWDPFPWVKWISDLAFNHLKESLLERLPDDLRPATGIAALTGFPRWLKVFVLRPCHGVLTVSGELGIE